jgi:transmembrane sensor
VILNAGSRVTVRYTESTRAIQLDQGQALFKVAKNPNWPFIVRVGDASVRAVGTQFDVYRKATGTTVTVVEGRVAVMSTTKVRASASSASQIRPPELLLTSGEQLTVASPAQIPRSSSNATEANSLLKAHPVKVKEATAWTIGLLVFDGAPLSEVVQEFNRQNTKPLVLASAELAELRISGTFPASGSERITRFLHDRFGVLAHETDDQIVLTLQ